ncbi:alpha-tubulin N-acetyltransferase-like [Haliotis rufescens]|uniref:alpha-tubulin N-acetyltransferase-like n=1 Tax=Haliotis rufescens TaxID=6454 RepID=UPI00201F2F77|nr:alpha-tubulin N-acetyltransferase-like [Haliotis rufescens]
MEYEFSVNALLEDVITRLDSRVLPRGSQINNDRIREHRKQLLHVIDNMGEASAKAQGLYGAITGGRKLELSDHILYLMKDPGANNGRGAIVGLLKTGHKKLFVYDNFGVQHEMTPLCILDFYVHESRQRRGCGKRLFEYMLRCENVRPNHFAIDKPSHKFSMFLAKHYNLRAIIPQVNNFVVFEGFFSNRTDVDHGRSRNGRPPVYRKPEDQRNGGTYSRAYTMDSKPPPGHLRGRPPSGKSSHRYQNAPSINPHAGQQNNPNPEISDLNLNPRPNSGSKQTRMLSNRSPNPVHLDIRSLSAGSNSSRGLGAGINVHSRHNDAPPDNRLQRHSSLDRLHALESRVQDPGPPMLQRAGAPPGYAEMMNLHHDYQGRQGHLKLQSLSSSTLPQVHPPPQNSSSHHPGGRTQVPVLYNPPSARSAYTPSSPSTHKDSSWTVHGIVPNHRSIASRHNMHNRLW